MSTADCSAPAIWAFPKLMLDLPIRYDHICIALIIMLICICAISKICSDYLVPGVEYVCYDSQLSFNVAGGTILAVACALPELLLNTFAVFVEESQTGLQAAIGSAIFNALCVTTVCALFSGVRINLDWWPITRDMLMYLISIITLLFVMIDNNVTWFEASIMVVLYLASFVLLLRDDYIQDDVRVEYAPCIRCFTPFGYVPDMGEQIEIESTEIVDDYICENLFKPWHCPQQTTCCTKFIWLLFWPINTTLFFTIPNVKTHFGKRLYIINLIMCIIWLGLLGYLNAWMATLIAFNLEIPEELMHVIVLGSSINVAEAFLGFIVARKGYGSMGISSAINSNTFSILLGLGLPWLISSFINADLFIKVKSAHLGFISFSLLSTTVAIYMSFMLLNFVQDRELGFTSIIIYLIFLMIVCLNVLNVFGKLSLKICDYKLMLNDK